MSTLTLCERNCTSEADAVAALEAAGYDAYPVHVPANARELHWHAFDAMTAVVSGDLYIIDEGGKGWHFGPGSIHQADAGHLHREMMTDVHLVLGFKNHEANPLKELSTFHRDPADRPNA